MEKRIKTLYIITIIAIVAFLAMQVYWLYGRYVFSLNEYERNLGEQIVQCVDEYNDIRDKASKHNADSLRSKTDKILTIPTFSLSQQYGDTVKTTRTAKIKTYLFSAYDLLGIEPGTPLTDEQKNRAIELAQQQTNAPADSVVYDASGAKDETEAWTATKNVQIERKCPFTVSGMDSVLNKIGVKAQISTAKADSMVWKNKIEYGYSIFRPKISLTIPYSQLEGQTVTIVNAINPLDVLPGMMQTLVISIAVSILLIVCLVLQFSTVLKLSRLDKMRNSFITTMIHELKRPISTLKMCVSGLQNEKLMTDSDTRGDLLGETRNALDNLSAYFSKLRDITFNNVEQIPLNIRNINLSELCHAVVKTIAIPAGKDADFAIDIDDSYVVPADPSHMANILTNLLENAVKYSGPCVKINVSAATDSNGNAEIKISDNGNGIPSGDIDHIFNRFYRGKTSSGSVPGMGLGLTYVKLLVNAHGGEIKVDSTVGQGTCFTIILPR